MPTIELVLAIAGLILGIVAVVEAQGKSWAGGGVVCVALALLLPHLT